MKLPLIAQVRKRSKSFARNLNVSREDCNLFFRKPQRRVDGIVSFDGVVHFFSPA